MQCGLIQPIQWTSSPYRLDFFFRIRWACPYVIFKKKVLYQRNNDGKPLNGLNVGKEDRMRMEIYLDDFLHNDKSLFLTEMNRNKSFDKDSELSVYHRIYNWFAKDLYVVLPDMPLTDFAYYYDKNSLNMVKK